MVEGDAFAGADDEGELGEGCECEEFAHSREDASVNDPRRWDDKSCNHQSHRYRKCHRKDHGM